MASITRFAFLNALQCRYQGYRISPRGCLTLSPPPSPNGYLSARSPTPNPHQSQERNRHQRCDCNRSNQNDW